MIANTKIALSPMRLFMCVAYCVHTFAYCKQQKFDVGKFGKFAYFAKLSSSKT